MFHSILSTQYGWINARWFFLWLSLLFLFSVYYTIALRSSLDDKNAQKCDSVGVPSTCSPHTHSSLGQPHNLQRGLPDVNRLQGLVLAHLSLWNSHLRALTTQ